jgi:hypothetical protein
LEENKMADRMKWQNQMMSCIGQKKKMKDGKSIQDWEEFKRTVAVQLRRNKSFMEKDLKKACSYLSLRITFPFFIQIPSFIDHKPISKSSK